MSRSLPRLTNFRGLQKAAGDGGSWRAAGGGVGRAARGESHEKSYDDRSVIRRHGLLACPVEALFGLGPRAATTEMFTHGTRLRESVQLV